MESFIFFNKGFTNIITWQFSLGPRWRFEINRLSLSLGYDLAFWFGTLNQFGFKSKIRGWNHYPNLTLGYVFDNFAISLKSELILVLSQSSKQDEVEIESDYNKYNEYCI